jgi:hypothetical protein
MALNAEQISALHVLDAALKGASDSGLMDELSAHCASNSSVNDVIDAVDSMFPLVDEENAVRGAPHVVFEVVGAGFDAGTDATDDRVFWIRADSADAVESAISGLGAKLCCTVNSLDAIDFTLPKDEEKLREKLASFVR